MKPCPRCKHPRTIFVRAGNDPRCCLQCFVILQEMSARNPPAARGVA